MGKECEIVLSANNTTFRCPKMLAEKYEAQLRNYGFRNKTEILQYLAIGIWKQENGIKISSPVRDIIKKVEIDRHPFLSSLPKTTIGIYFTDDEMTKVRTLEKYLNLVNLMNAIMEAFTFSGWKSIYWLRIEMHNHFVYDIPDSDVLSASFSEEQYRELYKMASRANLTLTGLVNVTIDTILKMEGIMQDKINIPFEMADALQKHLQRQGFTLHLFSYKRQFSFYVNDNIRFRQILELIHKYRIPGTNEFLRRVLLFLLNSKGFDFTYIPDDSYSEESDYFDENEMYYNGQLSRKDFVRSIYQ